MSKIFNPLEQVVLKLRQEQENIRFLTRDESLTNLCTLYEYCDNMIPQKSGINIEKMFANNIYNLPGGELNIQVHFHLKCTNCNSFNCEHLIDHKNCSFCLGANYKLHWNPIETTLMVSHKFLWLDKIISWPISDNCKYYLIFTARLSKFLPKYILLSCHKILISEIIQYIGMIVIKIYQILSYLDI